MAKLTEEQRQKRAAARARRAALEAEERDHRNRARREQWDREGTRLTREEYKAGVHCRGCGLPISDGLGAWRAKGTLHLTPQERAGYASEESRFRELHADCHSHRWGTANSATMHCGYCCPPPPMSPARFEKVMRLFESFGKPDPSQLDEWELSLTCDHTTRRTQHRSNGTRSSWYVVDCPECGTTRGVVESRLQGPAVDPEERPVVERERLEAELRLRRGQARPATHSRRESSAGCRRPPDSIKRAPRMMTTTPSSPKCWPSSQTPSAAHLGASSLFCRPD